MSGGSGSSTGSARGYEDEEDCAALVIAGQVVAPDPADLDLLVVNTILLISLVGNAVHASLENGTLIGVFNSNRNPQLVRCLRRKYRFIGRVTHVEGANCEIRIQGI
jgi:hypothetical protein